MNEVAEIQRQIDQLEDRKKALLGRSEVVRFAHYFANAARAYDPDPKNPVSFEHYEPIAQDFYAAIKMVMPYNTLKFCEGLIDILMPPKEDKNVRV